MFRRFGMAWVLSFSLQMILGTITPAEDGATAAYRQLRRQFASPDHARWGEVPLWWWEGDRLSEDRVRWQLETLAAAGVKSVCPIQRSPGRCDPQSFSPSWWKMFEFVHRECRRLGMTLWAYDQVGYGNYGWLEKAAAKTQDNRTARLVLLLADGQPGQPVHLQLPPGKILAARAYPIENAVARDDQSRAIPQAVEGIEDGVLTWTPAAGTWRVAVSVAVPDQTFQLSAAAADTFLDMFYGRIERQLGSDAMGTSFVGVFQDEHPPTPRDVYTDELADTFRKRFGYEITRAVPALHFDVGPLTPKYRSDFFDAYLAVDQRCYWKRIYDWTQQRNLLTSHDNWGRNNLYQQSQGYIDYFRTQRWFSAPGYDDPQQAPVDRRNYYDTKIASSIARLYGRRRVWCEAFHSSGWGRTTDQTLSWLSANFACGANLYDEHGLYYSTRAGTWEHAAPDPHWRQPYWRYYSTLSGWVARMSYLMSQGTHVVDVAVHYPVASLLAGGKPGQKGPDYNLYMQLSRTIYDAGIDNDIADDDSILNGKVEDGRLVMGTNGYRALVFGPEVTVRRSVLEKAQSLAESGGTVLFFGQLPSASTDAGRDDPRVAEVLQTLLGDRARRNTTQAAITNNLPGGGFCGFLPAQPEQLPRLISQHVERDFVGRGGRVFVTHRRIQAIDVYLLQNVEPQPIDLVARCRVAGVPERWDPFSGQAGPVDRFERNGRYTTVTQRIEGNTAELLVFRPGNLRRAATRSNLIQPPDLDKTLAEEWTFSVIPTRDNRWGEFRWPPSDERIGPEVRSFRYTEETGQPGTEQGWQSVEFDDAAWPVARYGIGPYWLYCQAAAGDAEVVQSVLDGLDNATVGGSFHSGGKSLTWQPVEFSQTIGLARPAPWGGHSGYPDGAIDQNFIQLPAGRKLLFTRIYSPQQQRLGLRVQLRNSRPRLWVSGVEQPFEDAVGNLPLAEGENLVLIDLPDGGQGMLYVQPQPPSVRSMDDVVRGMATPDLRAAWWIWSGDTHAAYFRRRFDLDKIPQQARVVVTGYTGYRLFVNGVKIEEEIGPWADWEKPESFNIRPHLRPGRNVIAAWGQVHAGQHVHGQIAKRGFILALQTRQQDHHELTLVSDGSWKGTIHQQDGWEQVGFDDSAWQPVTVLGRMGAEPWGTRPLENAAAVTEPRRKLAIDLKSPYLSCFDEVPDVRYDVQPKTASRIGWYRFPAPPGVKKLKLNTTVPARVWVDGLEAQVHQGIVEVAQPPSGVSTVAIRLSMKPGAYGGAAFPLPIGLELEGGTIRPGLWADFAMPTYSGIGVYRQTMNLTAAEAQRPSVLDLGQVLVAAEVFLNGRSAGVRLARPFKFDLTDLVKAGDNAIEVHLANTIAPHYTVTNQVQNLGPTDSGLLGPVVLRQQLPAKEWTAWARSEMARLQEQLERATPELEAAQRRWERSPGWTPLDPAGFPSSPASGVKVLPDGSWVVTANVSPENTYSFTAGTDLTGISGFRVEMLAGGPAAAEVPLRGRLEITATRPGNVPFVGRYVRVQLVDRNEFLHMAEVQVFSGSKNVAPAGRASQSSSHPEGPAALAIDGDANGSWSGHSVSHTGKQQDPWWEVDLGAMLPVNRIAIFNRIDGDLENRLDSFRVSLLDQSRTPVWQRTLTDPPNPSLTLPLSPAAVVLGGVEPKTGRDRQQGAEFAWGLRPPEEKRRVAVFRTRGPIGFLDGTQLTVRLTIEARSLAADARFRISATTMQPPLVDISPKIAQIRGIPRPQRTDRQRADLATFYRSVAPSLRSVRERLSTLEVQLGDAE